jgi:hypothetical protein
MMDQNLPDSVEDGSKTPIQAFTGGFCRRGLD